MPRVWFWPLICRGGQYGCRNMEKTYILYKSNTGFCFLWYYPILTRACWCRCDVSKRKLGERDHNVISFRLMNSGKWRNIILEIHVFIFFVHVSHHGQHFWTIIIKEGLDSSCISSIIFSLFHHNQIALFHFYKWKYYITICFKNPLLYLELIRLIILVVFYQWSASVIYLENTINTCY